MNLPKAIELNLESEDSLRKHKFPDHADAIKLGNEALKRLHLERADGYVDEDDKLPGED